MFTLLVGLGLGLLVAGAALFVLAGWFYGPGGRPSAEQIGVDLRTHRAIHQIHLARDATAAQMHATRMQSVRRWPR